MPLEPKDSAAIAKAIVDALNKAVSSMGRVGGAVPGGKGITRAEVGGKGQTTKSSRSSLKADKSILATAKNFDKLEDAAGSAAKSLIWMTQKVDKASDGLKVFTGSLGSSAGRLKALGKPIVASKPEKIKQTKLEKAIKSSIIKTTEPALTKAAVVPEEVVKAKAATKPKTLPPEKPSQKPTSITEAFHLAVQKKTVLDEAEAAKAVTAQFGVMVKVLGAVRDAIIQVADDSLHLAAQGYSTTAGLTGLYKSAIMAGMSLSDYTKMMNESMPAVSRASSFAEFQKNLSAGTDSLAKFGIFGAEATDLAASMMTASTNLGVPQAQMGAAMEAQIGVFENLRKTTNITAAGFKDLVKSLEDNIEVRTELAALDPQDRIARQTQLLDQISYAKSLNLSSAAQAAYTQSILDQRKTTVKQRFEQGGRLTQAGGLLGMGADKIDEMRQLSMNKYKTTEEQKRYEDLLGEVGAGVEKMQQSGNINTQAQADAITEMMGSAGLGKDIDAAMAVRMGKQAGPVQNKDMNQTVGDIGQNVGKLVTILTGIQASPFGSLMTGIVGALISNAIPTGTIMGTIAGSIIAAKMGMGTPGGFFDKIFGDKGGKGGGATGAKGGGKWGKILSFMGGAAGTAEAVSGINAPDWSTSYGADGSGGAVKGTAPTKGGNKMGAALKGAGGFALKHLGSLATLGMAGMDYFGADEKAKATGGDVGEIKGGAVGEGVGTVAGELIGDAVGAALATGLTLVTAGFAAPLAPLITIMGGILGAIGGGMLGKWLGALWGSKSATEKNTDEIIKARREKAGAEVVSSQNLGSLSQNVLQTSQAFAASAEKTGEAVSTIAVPVEATPTSTAAPVIASPATQAQSTINPAEINKPVVEALADQQKTAATAANITSTTVQDPAALLAQILAILQQSLTAENLQVDLASQILRANALIPKLQDNEAMARKVMQA